MAKQIRILQEDVQPDGSFTVTAVFWLSAPANRIVPAPAFVSADPNIDQATAVACQQGTLVEQSYTLGCQPAGTTQAQVRTALQTAWTAASSALANPPVTGIGDTYDGSSWSTLTQPAYWLRVPPSLPMNWAAAMARLPGVSYGRANGYVATSATTGKAIRATTYTPQGANAQRSFNSTSASDTAAGTGAQQMVVTFLNAAFQLKAETVTLNGVTPVNSVGTDLAYLENKAVSQVGSGGGNVGTLQTWTATAGGGSVWGSIAAGDNQTAWAHHYVPAGVTCYLLSVKGASLVTVGQINLNHSGLPSATNVPQLQIGPTIVHPVGDSRDHTFSVPIGFAGPDLIWLTTKPNAATADTSYGHFDYVQF